MGYIESRFMIVHATSLSLALEARALAVQTFAHSPGLVGPVMTSAVNGRRGFTVWTSGGKAGREAGNRHDDAIEALIGRLAEMEAPPDWCIVNSGEEYGSVSAEQGIYSDFDRAYERAVRS